MQNKNISLSLVLMVSLFANMAVAQEARPRNQRVSDDTAAADVLSDFSNTKTNKRKAVNFPPRSSLDTLELAPLPGVYETDINGPQAMAESVSANDMPSEQLLGRLTPEVFQEMAELERDNAFLKLQIQKETMKNDLENLRANYRQARLDEIAKREEVVRSRIQWWQEQEKLRQEMEKERAEAEEIKNQMDETAALKAQLEAAAAAKAAEETSSAGAAEGSEEPVAPSVNVYSLVDVKGTRGSLVARVKNVTTSEVSIVKVGDSLNGEVVTAITPDTVILDHEGAEYVIKFPTT
ncbi:MAG: hypothetical protein IKQ99_00035 [Alphaproteobacteria bacterium]|nr:hypothetical protein [Alphaproteobacteria bacterium]